MDALYTVPDVAKRWGVCTQAVYKLLRTGRLRGFKAGKEWRVTEEALREYELPPAGYQAIKGRQAFEDTLTVKERLHT